MFFRSSVVGSLVVKTIVLYPISKSFFYSCVIAVLSALLSEAETPELLYSQINNGR